MRRMAVVAGVMAVAAIVGSLLLAGLAGGRRSQASPLEAATVRENLGATIPLDLRFEDEEGQSARLGDLVSRSAGVEREAAPPVLLILAYFNCRTLCNLVLEGTARALEGLEWRAGEDYRVITVSIDPRDTPVAARAKRLEIVEVARGGARGGYPGGRHQVSSSIPESEEGPGAASWSFLVGSEPEIRELATAVGFGYEYDAATDQYSHPAVIFALTAAGEISSYIYGVNPEPSELGVALGVAAAGRTRTVFERVLLRCFHYVPALRRHAGLIGGVLRVSGVLTVVGLVVLLRQLVLRGSSRGPAP